MPLRSMEDTLETQLDMHETWSLEYSYGSPGLNLGISSIACNSFEECQEQLQYLLLHTSPPPLWARAIHEIEKHTVETTTHELMKKIQPRKAEREQASEAERYNREMDSRNRIIMESREKPWLPLHDGE